MSRENGPGEYLAARPVAYSLSLAGAGAAVGIFAHRAATSRGLRRLGWVLLSALEAAIFIGVVVVTEEEKRAASARSRSHPADGPKCPKQGTYSE